MESDMNYSLDALISDSKYILEGEIHPFYNPSECKPDNYHFNLLHLNCRSIKANFLEIQNLILNSRVRFSAIAVTETWLSSLNHDLYQIDGYKFISNNRTGPKGGGGVGFYLNICFDATILEELSIMHDSIECIFVEVSDRKLCRSFILGCIYRPPNSNMIHFRNDLEKILTTINIKKKNFNHCW